MNIWFIICYGILGVIGLGIIGYAFISTVMERHVGEDFMDEKNDEKCDQVFKELDPKIKKVQTSIGIPKLIVYVVLTLLCWPVSVPYLLHKIHVYGDYLEDYIRYSDGE